MTSCLCSGIPARPSPVLGACGPPPTPQPRQRRPHPQLSRPRPKLRLSACRPPTGRVGTLPFRSLASRVPVAAGRISPRKPSRVPSRSPAAFGGARGRRAVPAYPPARQWHPTSSNGPNGQGNLALVCCGAGQIVASSRANDGRRLAQLWTVLVPEPGLDAGSPGPRGMGLRCRSRARGRTAAGADCGLRQQLEAAQRRTWDCRGAWADRLRPARARRRRSAMSSVRPLPRLFARRTAASRRMDHLPRGRRHGRLAGPSSAMRGGPAAVAAGVRSRRASARLSGGRTCLFPRPARLPRRCFAGSFPSVRGDRTASRNSGAGRAKDARRRRHDRRCGNRTGRRSTAVGKALACRPRKAKSYQCPDPLGRRLASGIRPTLLHGIDLHARRPSIRTPKDGRLGAMRRNGIGHRRRR